MSWFSNTPSLRSYALGFILLVAALFGGLSWIALSDLDRLREETRQRNRQLAQEELEFTVDALLQEARDLSLRLSHWDEAVQQINNPTYYKYWLSNRVPSLGYLPRYFDAIQLYDAQGNPLVTQGDSDLPAKITLSDLGTVLQKQAKHDHLYHSVAIDYDDRGGAPIGFAVVELDFTEALNELQKFRYVDPTTVRIDAPVGTYIPSADINRFLRFEVSTAPGFAELQDLMLRSLMQLGATGASLALLFLLTLVLVVVLPLRRLTDYIDKLKQGVSASGSAPRPMCVAEFEKVRHSLVSYESELARQSSALRDNEARLRAVLSTVPDAIVTIDAERRIRSINSGAETLFGYSHAQAREKILDDLIDPAERQSFLDHFEQYVNASAPTARDNPHIELKGRQRTGRLFDMELVIAPMSGEQHTARAGGGDLVCVMRDISERKRAQKRLIYMANYDDLTGLPNRTLFHDRLEHAIAHAHREGNYVGLVFIDLDRFKTINDTLGHQLGDELLVAVARRLSQRMREGDTVARLGGDEFTLVIEGIDHPEDSGRVVRTILGELAAPFQLGGREVFATASAGITTYPIDASDAEGLLQCADTAMYRAKQLGGHTYQFFTADMNAQTAERLSMENDLRRALERSEFVVHYQPRIEQQNLRCVGVEALLRWQRPERGMVAPGQFIPILEETGLINEVGQWVLHEASRQLKAWRAHDIGDLRVSINLSPRQFRDGNLADLISETVSAAGLAPRDIELEITESLLVDDRKETLQVLKELGQRGFSVAIDDFGTGYSSLSYLKRFRIDTLKIDRSFVRDIDDQNDGATIVDTIIKMAHSLGLSVTAEGVETKQQLAFLKSRHCEEVQGYYFSAPLAADQFLSWLQVHRDKVA